MSFKTDEFLAALNKTGVAKSSNFMVKIHGKSDANIEREMQFRADTAELPGRTISTNEYRIYGPIRKIAYTDTYTDTTIGILCSEDLMEKWYFEDWQQKIVYHQAKKTGSLPATVVTTPAGSAEQPAEDEVSHHDIGYYDEYVATVVVNQYDEVGSVRSAHTFNEAYPIGIAPIAVNWGNQDLIRLNVTFAFRDYTMNIFPPDTSNKPKPNIGISGSVNIGGVNIGGNFSLNGSSNLSVGGFKVPIPRIPKVGRLGKIVGGGGFSSPRS